MFPGSGITPFTYKQLTYEWWRIFVARANYRIKESQESARGR